MLSHLKLFKAIKHVDSLETYKQISDDLFKHAELINSKWLNGKSQWSDCELPKQSDSLTYSKCTRTYITTYGSDIILSLTVWDGHSFDGCRDRIRCEFIFKLPYTKLKSTLYKYVSDLVEQELKMVAVGLYRDEQLRIENARIDAIYKTMLDKI